MKLEDQIIRLFPEHMRFQWKAVAQEAKWLTEIRLRADRPVLIYGRGTEFYLENGQLSEQPAYPLILSKAELEQILKHICRYSLYAYEGEMSRGFVSAEGGFRVGIAGEVIQNKDGSIKNIRCISSMNIRIAHEIKGAALPVLPYLYEGDRLLNTLLVSPPGCGKTTMLRDIIRLVSEGSKKRPGQTVGLVDERSEIAGCFQGVPKNDVGSRTDVLDGCPKAEGMMLLLRSMSPRVVAVDELGSQADMQALEQVLKCGCSVLATVHGSNLAELQQKAFLKPLLKEQVFERILVLGKTKEGFLVEALYCGDGRLHPGWTAGSAKAGANGLREIA